MCVCAFVYVCAYVCVRVLYMYIICMHLYVFLFHSTASDGGFVNKTCALAGAVACRP